ncbi:MAG: hypothetical protein HW387_1785 [Parachlamydiales bacterium]|nr:hypothetical protein [Parachlamydiales bacterium]
MSASPAIGASGLGSPPSPTDPKQAALEQCKARVELAVQQVQWSHLYCSITLELPKYPVVTNCNHLFDGSAIQAWMLERRDPTCPLCRVPLTVLTPLQDLQESDDGRLSQHLQLEEPEKATLKHLHSSLNLLQERKIQEAINTLELCKPEILDISTLVVGLKLQFSPSPENVEWAMTRASKHENPDDRIFIYQQVIAHVPCRLDAYQELISLTKEPKEKRALLLQAADRARDAQQLELEMSFRKEAEIPLISTVISKEEWAAAQTINLPPYPQALIDFLAGDCTIWPGKKRWETHIVVPLFPQVAIDGAPVPFTLESLDQLDISSGGPGYGYIWVQIPKNIPAENEFRYAVMTNDVIPGSRNMSYNDQLGLLPPGYEAPGVFDAARAILWENRRSGNRCFNDHPWTFTRCKETVSGSHLIVGGFAPSGLIVHRSFSVCFGDEDFGVAGWRKF